MWLWLMWGAELQKRLVNLFFIFFFSGGRDLCMLSDVYIVICVYFIRRSSDGAKSCQSTSQSAGRETSLHVGEKEEKDGCVYL